MKIEKVNINDLISPSYNPREITPEEMEKLKTSIQEFGYVDPIIVNEVNQHIVGGNQRYYAMKELSFTEVEVVYIHEEDLNREKTLNIALNKISGDWNTGKLSEVLEDIQLSDIDIYLTGFDDIELEDYIIPDFQPVEDDGTRLDEKKQYSVLVHVDTIEEQDEVYLKLKEWGYECTKN